MSNEIKTKSAIEILNEKYKSCIPSEFDGKVWDNKLIEAMHEFANQQQKPLSDAIEFGKWLGDNWYDWDRIKQIYYREFNEYTTEQLYEIFKQMATKFN